MSEIRNDLSMHLASIGFEFQASRQVILDKLRQRMGETRFSEFMARQSASASSQEEFYKQFRDIIEGNLMRSLDSTATLDASCNLYEKALARLLPCMRVIELGCWTGGLSSFIAMRHPNVTVVGVDFARHVIEACNAHYRLPNLRFQQWNYRWGKPESLEPADVLVCGMGVVHHHPDNSALSDLAAVRRTREYITQRDHAIGYFSVWRSAAKEGGYLFAALRIGLFARFLAWIEAAQQTGWTPRLELLWHVDMSDEKNPLPGLVFEAGNADPLPEGTIVDKWMWFTRRDHVYARLEGASALAAFRGISNKKVLAARSYRKEQLLTHDEIGLENGSGYVFTHDALFRFRLLLTSSMRAQELANAVLVKGEDTPISNEGLLGRGRTSVQFDGARTSQCGEMLLGGASFGGNATEGYASATRTAAFKRKSVFAG